LNMSILQRLDEWEVGAILAVALTVLVPLLVPSLARGLRLGWKEFKKSAPEIQNEIERAAHGGDDDNNGGPLAV
jgi:Sec-independent protein translocase protein TatA